MRKSEIVTYMRGFVDCYNTMIDLIDDETEPKALANVSETKPDISELIIRDTTKKSNIYKEPKPRTGTNVPEPRNVPHAPEKPTKTPLPDVKPTHDKFVELFKEGKLPTEVAKELGVSPATAYNHLYKAKQAGELK